VVLHLKKHGMSLLLEEEHDHLQLETLFVESWRTLRLVKDDKKSCPCSLERVIADYPFHEPHPNLMLEPACHPLEQCHHDRCCTKLSAMAVVEDETGEPDLIVVENNVKKEPSDPRSSVGKEKANNDPELVTMTFTQLRGEDRLAVEKHGWNH
jgi:hypothetical protein